ncbi:hypothetical protein, partial [uncultured Eubacterium sp.]|uniref:hypothetical protein n=1 Tax=uncultured Eubacterium sp. TaxID=165185 RepID=UPI003263AD95
MLAFMIILMLMIIINKEILKRLFKEYGTPRNILLCLVILILLCVILYQIPSVNHQIESVLRRITGAKREMGEYSGVAEPGIPLNRAMQIPEARARV